MSRHKNKKMSAVEQAEYIKKALGYKTYAKPPEYWLDLKSSYANKVFGSKKLGAAFGKIILIAGEPSSGKSAVAAYISGLGQKEGADVGWVDGENSYDPKHVSKQGLDPEKVSVFAPEYGEFKYKKSKGKKLVSEEVEAAEDLFTRVETWMKLRRKSNPDGKLVVVVDSTTSFAPEEELMGGLTDQNMRTKVSPAVFMNNLTKRWVGLAVHTNALIIMIAQLRTNLGVMFGEKRYVPGGKGLGYYASVVVWMNRIKGGAVKKNGRQVGVKGVMQNRKNKAGGGSVERKKCGYKCFFYKKRWEFLDPDELKKEGKEKDNA